jgi:hypothetical protein
MYIGCMCCMAIQGAWDSEYLPYGLYRTISQNLAAHR